MTQHLNTLLTALYVKIDDELEGTRWLGRPPKLTDPELVCLAVAQVLLGFASEARWLRFARTHLAGSVVPPSREVTAMDGLGPAVAEGSSPYH